MRAVPKRSLRRSPSSATFRSKKVIASVNSPRARWWCQDRTLRPPRPGDRQGSARWLAPPDALEHHEGGNPPEPVLIAKRPCERLRCKEVISHTHIIRAG